jgi:hypothetical protein
VILPNLASRPLLNSRPVWLVTAVASFLALVFVLLNVHLYFYVGEAQEEQHAVRDQLVAESRDCARSLPTTPVRSRACRGPRWAPGWPDST